jgi:hypothetical protein
MAKGEIQMIDNLQLEVKRHRLQRQFIRMVELDEANDNLSQDTKPVEVGKTDILNRDTVSSRDSIPLMDKTPDTYNYSQGINTSKNCICATPDTSLKLSDTEHPDLKIGIQKNGRKYSVRTNRKRFFFPND